MRIYYPNNFFTKNWSLQLWNCSSLIEIWFDTFVEFNISAVQVTRSGKQRAWIIPTVGNGSGENFLFFVYVRRSSSRRYEFSYKVPGGNGTTDPFLARSRRVSRLSQRAPCRLGVSNLYRSQTRCSVARAFRNARGHISPVPIICVLPTHTHKLTHRPPRGWTLEHDVSRRKVGTLPGQAVRDVSVHECTLLLATRTNLGIVLGL